MKFWCGTSRRNSITKSNASLSSSVSYAIISLNSIKKSDSGYSEISSIEQTCSFFQQILVIERTHHENLKEYISKYSRPLRRVLNPTEIVDLFQNIEKISTISKSIVRQCEKLLNEHHISDISITMIYQSTFGMMIDAYNTYISRSINALRTLKQSCDKIAYFLRIPLDVVVEQELREFILLPLRYICILNDLFQNYDLTNMSEAINFLSEQANSILQPSCNDQRSTSDLSFQSEIPSVIVFQRTDKEPWKSKRLDLSESRLSFSEHNESSIHSSICLSNVVHIEENTLNEELCLSVASNLRKSSRYSSIKLNRIYIRFEEKNDYCIWLHYLRNAIQDAKDQSWSKTHELLI